MTTLIDEGDVYVARKTSGPRLIMKSGRYRGLEGILYDAEAYIDVAVEK